MNFFLNFFGKGNSNRCFSLPKNRTTSHQKRKRKKKKQDNVTELQLQSTCSDQFLSDHVYVKEIDKISNLRATFTKKKTLCSSKRRKNKKRKKGKKKKKEDSLYSIKTYHYQRSDYLLYGGHQLHQSLKTRFMSRILVQYIL